VSYSFVIFIVGHQDAGRNRIGLEKA
jgi:hypothetical protein